MAVMGLLARVPVCLSHGVMDRRLLSVKLSDGKSKVDAVWYCSGCDKYVHLDDMVGEGEKALSVARFGCSLYELSDIVRVDWKKL